jgi:hypothetical protein
MFDADFNSRAFLWKDGVMVDLNDLIPKDSPWVLQSAAGVNASGQIAGQGLINGEVHAFLPHLVTATKAVANVARTTTADSDARVSVGPQMSSSIITCFSGPSEPGV